MMIKRRWQVKAAMHVDCIKNHYLKCGHTPEDWQNCLLNPTLFNRAWRAMLGIDKGDMPPPLPFRMLPQ